MPFRVLTRESRNGSTLSQDGGSMRRSRVWLEEDGVLTAWFCRLQSLGDIWETLFTMGDGGIDLQGERGTRGTDSKRFSLL